jgi:hypothetical protein
MICGSASPQWEIGMLLGRGVVAQEPSRFSGGLVSLTRLLLLFFWDLNPLLASHLRSALLAY